MRRSKRRLLYVVAVAALAASAVAVATAAASTGSDVVAAAPAEALVELDLAAIEKEAAAHEACMREHGFELPDPVTTSAGVYIDLGEVAAGDDFMNAATACGAALGIEPAQEVTALGK